MALAPVCGFATPGPLVGQQTCGFCLCVLAVRGRERENGLLADIRKIRWLPSRPFLVVFTDDVPVHSGRPAREKVGVFFPAAKDESCGPRGESFERLWVRLFVEDGQSSHRATCGVFGSGLRAVRLPSCHLWLAGGVQG